MKKENEDEENLLPPLQKNESINKQSFTPNQHFHQPPRFK